ncbi:MAG: ATP-binding cassette domain-containing protein [Flexilinea sp.]
MRDEILRVEGLTKYAWNTFVLHNMHLMLFKGEVLGITGVIGSGLSSLANVLSGVDRYDSGQVLINDQDVKICNVMQAQENGIFCIRHNSTLINNISILENLCLADQKNSRWLCYSTRQDLQRAKKVFQLLDISISPTDKPEFLTLAERHMIEIARAVFCGGQILILDDILRLYSGKELLQLETLLQRVKAKGLSVIWIDSRPERLLSISDRIIIMKSGRSVGLFNREDFNEITIRKVLAGAEFTFQRIETNRNQDDILLEAVDVRNESLSGINFKVHKGEAVGFINTDGRVCPHIIELLSGNAKVISGTLLLEGKPMVVNKGRQAMVSQGIGFVEYYRNALFPRLSVRHNLTIASLNELSYGPGISEKMEKFAVGEYTDMLNISNNDLEKKIIDTDNAVQLEIALYKWLLAKVKLIVMDNVFSGTDIVMHNLLIKFINEAKRRNIGIVYMGLNASEVYKICDSVYVSENEKICESAISAYL